MGFGGVSIWQLLIVLVIVLVLFGTKKLRSLGSDLGGAVQGFKKSLKDGGQEEEEDAVVEASDQIQEEVDHEEVVSTAQNASAKKSAEQKPAEPKTAKQKPAEQKT